LVILGHRMIRYAQFPIRLLLQINRNQRIKRRLKCTIGE
jgi:hypothetical protein